MAHAPFEGFGNPGNMNLMASLLALQSTWQILQLWVKPGKRRDWDISRRASTITIP
jgi:hypothetical protein